MVTRASCIVYHKFTHHPFRTKIKWRLPIPISEKHYKLITWFWGPKSSKVFVMGILLLKPNRVMSQNTTVVSTRAPETVSGRNQDAPSKRSSRAFEAFAVFLAQKSTIVERRLPPHLSHARERKGKQSCWCYICFHISSFEMLLARKTIYTIWCYWISCVSLNNFRNHVKKNLPSFQLLEQPSFVSRNLAPRVVP